MGQKVLVVDDEKLIVKGIRFSLEQDGMEVDCAYDGEEALELARHNAYDMVLLDVMLPKMTGFEVCQQIREFSNVPIVMLTAKGEDMDKILGLDYGADDYITKPFNILEVKARIKAIMRRTVRGGESRDNARVVEKGGMRLVCDSRRVYIDGREINLTAKEFEVLELLMKKADVTPDIFPAVAAALEKESRTGAPAGAMVMPDGAVITGKTSDLLGASAALLLNALKHLGGIDQTFDLISAQVLAPICRLKTESLGNKNPRLHSDEVLIALCVSALTNPIAALAQRQLPKLKNCAAHFTVVLSAVDENLYHRLGMHISCEAKYERRRLYYR